MAYAALVSLQQTTDMILNHDRYSISVDEREKITSIREYVIFMVSLLEDFPEKASRFEGQIRDAANEAEDTIEYFVWKQIHIMNWCTVGLSRDAFEHQLKKATQEIGLIAGEMMDDRLTDSPAAAISSSRSIEPTAKVDIVIGLHDDLIAIKGRLCGESSKLEVVPIVGMGGIGKTTLARVAYDDQLIMEHFEVRAWVTVSQDYSAQQVLFSLQDSMKLFEEQMLGENDEIIMAEKVYKSLKGRRYLIVMDDVWSTNAWDDIWSILPDDNNGSRIMLTTRLSNVAAYADSRSPFHRMQFMDGNQSWNLLKQKVFTRGQDCPPELEDVGKEIARSCGGLPLAVVLVAGILSTVAKTQASWNEIAKNLDSVVDGQLEKILSLSYTHLPHHLRPCFLFLGGIPKYYRIRVSRLIKLWVAEGFLRSRDGQKSLEDEAEACLLGLVKRNLVLVTRRKTNGKIKRCGLHGLVRDLCVRKAEEEKFLHVVERKDPPKSIKHARRVSTSHPQLENVWDPSVHTILWFVLSAFSASLPFVGGFRLLRVLEVVNYIGIPLPSQVFELFHLRYLALGNYIKIPAAISNLTNLQTLIIQPVLRFSADRPYFSCLLPPEIWRMPQLRHVVLLYDYELPEPAGNGSTLPLENLQTLSAVASLVCSEKVLEMIPNLKKLGIVYFENPGHQYHLHNLILLHKLEKLKVAMHWSFSWRGRSPAFPTTLKKLALVGGRLPWEDMNIVGSLPNLEVLKLRDFACDGDTWGTTDGEFPQLRFLLIERSELRHWITESSHFPRLRRLVLHHCLHLKEIPEGIGEILTLKSIEVDDQNQSLVESAEHIQEDQQSYGNDALQVRCIRHLEEPKKHNIKKYSIPPESSD